MQNPIKPDNYDSPGRKHLIRLPRTVLVGSNVLEGIPKIINEADASKTLIIAGPTTWGIAGEYIAKILDSKDIGWEKYIAEEATKKEAEKALEQSKEKEIKAVLGVGGGKNIDIAKIVAREFRASMLSIPTALSHDGITSPFASLKKREQKFSEYALSPLAVFVDFEKVASAPKCLIRSGFGDILSNLNAVLDWKLAHEVKGEYYGGYASKLSEMAGNLVMNAKDTLKTLDLEAIRKLAEAIISSGIAMGIAGSSRPASGAGHLFSHSLDSINEELALHGEQCGVGTILMLYHRGDKRWKKVRDVLTSIGAPTTAEELGIPPEIIIKALVKAPTIRDRYTILNEKPLNEKSAKKLAKATKVI